MKHLQEVGNNVTNKRYEGMIHSFIIQCQRDTMSGTGSLTRKRSEMIRRWVVAKDLSPLYILDIPRKVCKKINENSTDSLIKQINSQLSFSRNYEKIRPYTDYCEEMISIEVKNIE